MKQFIHLLSTLLVFACILSAGCNTPLQRHAMPLPPEAVRVSDDYADWVLRDGALWTLERDCERARIYLLKVAPETGEVVARFLMGEGTGGRLLDVGDGAAWLETGGRVLRFDFDTNRFGSAVHIGDAVSFSWAEGAGWAAGRDQRILARIDPLSGAVVSHVPLADRIGDVGAGEGAVWILPSNRQDRLIWIDPKTNRETTITMPAKHYIGSMFQSPNWRRVTSEGDSLWVLVNERDFWRGPVGNKILCVDLQTNEIVSMLELGEQNDIGMPLGIHARSGVLYVLAQKMTTMGREGIVFHHVVEIDSRSGRIERKIPVGLFVGTRYNMIRWEVEGSFLWISSAPAWHYPGEKASFYKKLPEAGLYRIPLEARR